MRIVIDTAAIWRAAKAAWRAVVPGVCGGYFDGTTLVFCGERAEYARGFCLGCIVAQKKAAGI